MPYQCEKCRRQWDDQAASDNEFSCMRKCGGRLLPVEHAASPPPVVKLGRLPYPVALTANRLQQAIDSSADVLKTLFALKDCFEATIKYLGVVSLTEYFHSPACTPERNETLIEKMVRPSLGHWVNNVLGDLSHWLVPGDSPRITVPPLFATAPAGSRGKPKATPLLRRCREFVTYRNDALGHGAMRSESVYATDLEGWLPMLSQLLDAVAAVSDWRLCLVTDRDRCQVWMGPEPGTATEPGSFQREQIGHFVLRGPDGDQPTIRDLHPFLCYLPDADAEAEKRLHLYDSVYRYQQTRKEVSLLEYDNGFKQASSDPVPALEDAFTAELLTKAFKRHQGRMEVIEGRVANFGELLVEHADIVGRRFVIDHVQRFVEEHDRGLLVIEAEPGKGKTAIMCHLIEEVYGHCSPPPVHFFYRRTAGITDPDVCVRSLYASLLEAHSVTESEESREQTSPEEVFHKLTNLLSETIAPKLSPSRPQIIFVDALDEADRTQGGRNAFERLPENLPEGVYFIATTRPVWDQASLARRAHLKWYNLDSPDLLQENLRDGGEYVQRELAASSLPGELLDELARVGKGNFLVLKLLCSHVATRLELQPEGVGDFLGRLATDGAKDQLGFIYQEFWRRLTDRLSREDINLLCDVAGLMVTARAPLTAEMVCECLHLRAGDWDFALRHLAEYLTAITQEEEELQETYYRIYHESFADFLRSKVASDRSRYENVLAGYCLGWSGLAAGRGRLYALRFGPAHLRATGRWDELETLLTNILFLEAKNEAGLVFELAYDFADSVVSLPDQRPRRRILRLLEKALHRDIYFIARHANDYPQGLFQCLWNTCWWYDCSEAAKHYLEPDGGWTPHNAPWMQPDDAKLCSLLETWRRKKEEVSGPFVWVRSLYPPEIRLGSAQWAVFLGHERGVLSVSFSPTGDRIVSASENVHVWDAESGKELNELRGHEDEVLSVSFSPTGDRIVSGSCDGTVRVWDATSGQELAVLRGHQGAVSSVSFSPTGDRIVSGSSDKTVRVWDATGGQELAVLRTHQGPVSSVSFSPTGDRIVSGSSDKTVRVWDATSGQLLAELQRHEDQVSSMSFSRAGDRIVSGSDEIVRVWNATYTHGQELADQRRYEDQVSSMSFSRAGDRIVSGSDEIVRVWDATGGQELAVLRGHEDVVSSVSFSPTGDRIVSVSDEIVRVWDATSGQELAVLRGHQDMSFSPTGNRIVRGSHDGTVHVWDVADGLDRFFPPHLEANLLQWLGMEVGYNNWVHSVSFSPTEDRIVSGSSDKTVRVWDATGGQELAVLRGHEDVVSSVSFSPTGDRIISGSHDKTARVWDATSGQELAVLRGHKYVSSVSFSPIGDRIVSGSIDGTMQVWDMASGQELSVLRGHKNWVYSVSFSPTGDLIVSVSDDETVRVWDAENYECVEMINMASGTSQDLPWRLLPHEQGLLIKCADQAGPDGWFPGHFGLIVTHPNGRTWAGNVGSHVYIITLEGAPPIQHCHDQPRRLRRSWCRKFFSTLRQAIAGFKCRLGIPMPTLREVLRESCAGMLEGRLFLPDHRDWTLDSEAHVIEADALPEWSLDDESFPIFVRQRQLTDALDGGTLSDICGRASDLQDPPTDELLLEAFMYYCRHDAFLPSIGARPPELPGWITNSIGMEMVLIPAGEFLMGSPESEAGRRDNEGPQHLVRITQPFYLGVYAVTQREYWRVMGWNPSAFSKSGEDKHGVLGLDTSRFPVETATWRTAVEFCRLLSSLPEERAAGREYRLPTEAEWEYACRAGTSTPFHFGTTLSGREANCSGKYPHGAKERPYRTMPVGSYEPNAFGVYDMHGNVLEWCGDWYEDGYYGRSPVDDPQGPSMGSSWVHRGGSWWSSAERCRSAHRGESRKTLESLIGFRVAF